MNKAILTISIMLLLSPGVSGQGTRTEFFKESKVLKPFISEIRSTVIKTEFAFLNKLDKNYYVSDYTGRPFIETHLGVDIPVMSYSNTLNGLKFNLSGEIGNILLIDMFEEFTAPVINTDYFFGLRAGAIKYLENSSINNIGLEVVPVFHESTHLGDEFSIHGFNDIPDFKRINISYEAWELAVVINDPDTIMSNLFSLKAGLQGLWNPGKGYYSTDTLETKGYEVPQGKMNPEYYLQFNLQRTDGFLCSASWMNIASLEIRNRIRFSYDINIPEERKWNYNLYFGWKHRSKTALRNIGFFLRYYHGIIPNGQFRNTDGYNYFGLSIIYS
ncbi:MAG: DUF1207 domain-containing protein [Marinilabiliaceae bacterium]|nr:DUF1207 domain-containing protein [Marinilabiliaceae bacterium]